MQLADQPAARAGVLAQHHGAGRARPDAHLVFQRDGAQIVSMPGAVVLQTARHQEQRQSFDAGGRVRRARQHQVDDVVRHIVLAPGDIDLAPDEQPGVPVRPRQRAHRRQIRTRLRFRQAHGGGPFTADQRWHIQAAQGRVCRGPPALRLRRPRFPAHRKGEVRAAPDFGRRGRDQHGQRLSAPGLRRRQRRPAIGAELAPGGGEARSGDHPLSPTDARPAHHPCDSRATEPRAPCARRPPAPPRRSRRASPHAAP